MTFETPSQHEIRTMPESLHQSPSGTGGQWAYLRTRKQWLSESNAEHDHKWNTDPEYRRECIERESQLKEMQKGNYLI